MRLGLPSPKAGSLALTATSDQLPQPFLEESVGGYHSEALYGNSNHPIFFPL